MTITIIMFAGSSSGNIRSEHIAGFVHNIGKYTEVSATCGIHEGNNTEQYVKYTTAVVVIGNFLTLFNIFLYMLRL